MSWPSKNTDIFHEPDVEARRKTWAIRSFEKDLHERASYLDKGDLEAEAGGENLSATEVGIGETLRCWLDKINPWLNNFIWKPQQGWGQGISEQSTKLSHAKELAWNTHPLPPQHTSSKIKTLPEIQGLSSYHLSFFSTSPTLGAWCPTKVANKWKWRQSKKQEENKKKKEGCFPSWISYFEPSLG